MPTTSARTAGINMSNHYNAPLYKTARSEWLRVHQEQIDKGAAKYQEPLNPESWTALELVEHALQENIDQFHYLIAIRMKLLGEVTHEEEPKALDQYGTGVSSNHQQDAGSPTA